jgi:hypothetical protein
MTVSDTFIVIYTLGDLKWQKNHKAPTLFGLKCAILNLQKNYVYTYSTAHYV